MPQLMLFIVSSGEDVWKYVGKISDAQRSMLDDRFKWKVSIYINCCRLCYIMDSSIIAS